MKNSAYEWNDVIQELTKQDGGVEKFLDELIEINENSDSPIIVDTRSYSITEYERGYEAALKQIKRNLEHMCKGMWSAEPITPYGEGCLKDLEVDIKFMFEACSKPILKESDLPDSGEHLSGMLHSNGLLKENGL